MEEKILEKEYNIPFDLFEKSFTIWQKKFVNTRANIMSILFLIIGIIYIFTAVKDPSNTITYLLIAVAFAFSGISWYNPKKIKRMTLETVKTMQDEKYKMQLFETHIEIGTIFQNEEVSEENEVEKEIFGDEPQEVIQSTKLYFNNGLKVLEYDEFFIVYQVKQLYYIIPKANFTDEEIELFKKTAIV